MFQLPNITWKSASIVKLCFTLGIVVSFLVKEPLQVRFLYCLVGRLRCLFNFLRLRCDFRFIFNFSPVLRRTQGHGHKRGKDKQTEQAHSVNSEGRQKRLELSEAQLIGNLKTEMMLREARGERRLLILLSGMLDPTTLSWTMDTGRDNLAPLFSRPIQWYALHAISIFRTYHKSAPTFNYSRYQQMESGA